MRYTNIFAHFGKIAGILSFVSISGGIRSLNVSRCQNLFDLNFNDRASSIAVPHCAKIFAEPCCQGRSKRIYTSLDNLENIEFDKKVSSISPCGEYATSAPHQIHETWSGHGQIMTKVAEGFDTAIYYNDDIIRTGLRSHSEYLRKLWKHVKSTYGSFGPENSRLFAFFHAKVPTSLYLFNSIQSYFDIQSECRNIIDFVGQDEKAWSRSINGTEEMDMLTHEVSHIVEWSSYNVHGSPTYQLWGDSAWAEIFTFDAYYSMGYHQDKDRWYSMMMRSKYDFPKENTYWFRDWLFPVYKCCGGSQLLTRYFEKLSKHFPRKENGWEYARHMNMGEHIHFMSGAAKVDLKPIAVRAFKWDSKFDRELQEAKKHFPAIWY